MEKKDIRCLVRKLRSEQNADERIRRSGMITENLFSLRELQYDFVSGKKIALFKSFDGEPYLESAYNRLSEIGVLCFFPVIETDRLFMVRPVSEIPDDKRFRKGGLGILEPAGTDRSFERMDIVLIPGIAFSETGSRVGFGKGYYDKYLAEYDAAQLPLIIAPVFDFQIIDGITAEPHDVPVDIIVTETKIIHPGKL